MKLTTLLIFIGVLNISAGVYSQDSQISVNIKNGTLSELFNIIEKKTEYKIFYKTSLINESQKIDLNVDQMPVSDLLTMAFTGKNLTYDVVDKVIVITPSETAQQQLKISGTITDSNTGEALPGVSIQVDGTTIGTISDVNGKYSIEVPNQSSILVFSYLGYLPQKITASVQTIDVKLVIDAQKLDEVVVIGYGTQKKAAVTSSIATVRQDNFIKGSVTDAGQLIQGKVAGLTISTVSGDPTSGTQVKLRGNSTILGTNTNPLVIVDGVPGDFNTVAPEDIESMDVLKDGSAAAIYGTRGTNGVIIITTKKASGNYKSTVEYSTYASTQTISRKLDMSTAADVRDQIAKGYRAAGDDLGYSTDWLKEITRTPISHSHNLTIRGGNSKTNYLVSVNYKSVQGVMLKSDNNLLNIRADLNHLMFNDKVKININAITRYDKFSTTGDGISFNGYTYRQANIYNPTAPVKRPDGSWYEEVGAFNYDNPVSRIEECDGQNNSQFSRINGSISFEPIKGLILKSLLSYSKYDETRGYAETKKNISTLRYGLNGLASNGLKETEDRLADLTIEYTKAINKHNLSIMGGYSYQENHRYESWMRNVNFPTDQFSYSDIQLGTGLKDGSTSAGLSSGRYITNLIGFFGRFSYNYDDKYLLMASLRREAANQLSGTNNPWGSFPAVSLGWRVSKESFMKDVQFVNDLKIRGGYGVTGSQPDQLFLGVSTLSYTDVDNNAVYFYSDGKWKNVLAPVRNANPYLRWEEKKETNIGFDFAILENRVSGTFDYYKRSIDGLLYDYTVPVPPNLVSTTRANVGKMDNKGIEALVNIVPIKKANFEWATCFTFSTNHNELVTLSNELYTNTTGYINAGATGEPIQTYTHRLKVGGSVGDFYGFKVVDISDQGRWIYQDKAGNSVGSETFARVDSNKMVLGNGLPKYYLGWNNTIKYKRFDLSVTMRGAFGFQILNFNRMYLENTQTSQYNRLRSAYDKVFGKAVLSTKENLEFNSYYVENGDYWKIDNITLGYNFNLKGNKYIKEARIYISTLNTFIITKYKGLDPEVPTDGLTPGCDYRDQYPTTRTYTIGLNVKF